MKISGKSMEVLMLLASTPNWGFSGYDIGKRLSIASGTLYPLLLKLEQAGMLTAKWEDGDPHDLGRPRRRYHTISGHGIKCLQDHMKKFDTPKRSSNPIFGGFNTGDVGV